MTAKQKAIVSAFGDAWNLLTARMQQHILKVHHWVDRSQNRMNLSPKDLGFDEETECEVHCEFWRPKSLSGIEHNNGWTRIESEADLPKEDNKIGYIVIDTGGYIQFTNLRHLINRIDEGHPFTHYQPITKPEKPIY